MFVLGPESRNPPVPHAWGRGALRDSGASGCEGDWRFVYSSKWKIPGEEGEGGRGESRFPHSLFIFAVFGRGFKYGSDECMINVWGLIKTSNFVIGTTATK